MVYIRGIFRRRPLKTSKKWVMGLSDEFPWGSHRNRTVQWVLSHHPQYIEWLIKLPDASVKFADDVIEILELKKAEPGYDDTISAPEFYKEYRGYR